MLEADQDVECCAAPRQQEPVVSSRTAVHPVWGPGAGEPRKPVVAALCRS